MSTYSELQAEVAELKREAHDLVTRADSDLTDQDAERFDQLEAAIKDRKTTIDRLQRAAEIARAYSDPSGSLRTEAGSIQPVEPREDRTPAVQQRDAAMRTIDASVKDGTMQARGAETIERLVTTGAPAERSWVARYAAAAASPLYLRAFQKMVADPMNGSSLFTAAESEAWRAAAAVQAERAMSTVDNLGGFLIPAQLDPAILLSSSGSANPLRQMARVVQSVGDVANFVSSDGVSAHWYNEAEEVSDDSPTLAQPSVPSYRGSAWVPFSIEIEGDGAGFASEIGKLLMDSIEQLTAAAYTAGTGVDEPTGFVTALTGTSTYVVNGVGSETVAAADPYALQAQLPPRFQANSAFAAALPTINVLRQSVPRTAR